MIFKQMKIHTRIQMDNLDSYPSTFIPKCIQWFDVLTFQSVMQARSIQSVR